MAEVSGIFPNMVGALESTGAKTATEINTKTQGQLTRLAMIVDTINQDLIIPNVEKVAKLCADFKQGVETIYVNHENKQEIIEVDDAVRQGEYKYTYSDSTMSAQKSEQADLVVSAVERFAQLIPLNIQEIFTWYFEQKGVDNPERFLGTGVNEGKGVNDALGETQNATNVEDSNVLNSIPLEGGNLKNSLEQFTQQNEEENIFDSKENNLFDTSNYTEIITKFLPIVVKIADYIKKFDKNNFSNILSKSTK